MNVIINPPNCGQRPIFNQSLSSKIKNGTQAINGDWGWQIILYHDDSFACSGSLINSLWIVTAAHCFYGRSSLPSRFKIGLGIFNTSELNPWSVMKTAVKIIMHEAYSNVDFSNDIALIQLDVCILK